MLTVGVLGPTCLLADDGTATEITARRQAELLAALAAHRGRAVSADALADLLWRGDPPRSASVTLQGYVSRLRQLLEPDRPVRREESPLQTSLDGYRLTAPTDVDLFEASVEEARDRLGADPAGAADLLTRALGRWRGEAYAGVRDLPALAPEVERTDELRTTARELHGQALLTAGRDAKVLPELRRLVTEHPLRERAHTLLATALFRVGRQADALAVLRDLRTRLVDELGVDPGPEAVETEQRLLRQDPALLATRPSPAPTPTSAPAVPARDPGFAGRAEELAALHAAWGRARAGAVVTVVVRGDAGIGKTSLVEQVAAAAEAGGAAVRWGRCPAVAGAPAYWLWTQVLGPLPDPGADREAGRFALGLEIARDLAAEVDPDFLLVVALGHAEAGHPDVALPAIDRLLASPWDGQRVVPRTVMLTEALVALGDAERLRRLLPVLESWGERIVVQWPGDVCMGPAALYRGSALAVLGDRDRAREELERAVALAELIGAAPYADRARRRLAAL